MVICPPALTQTLPKLSAEVPQLRFRGVPFGAIAAGERLHPARRISDGAPEEKARHAGNRRDLSQIEAQLRDWMHRLHPRARNAFAVPPSPEVLGLQSARGNVMPDPHGGHIQAAHVDAARAREEFR
jgi:hypothetical protein